MGCGAVANSRGGRCGCFTLIRIQLTLSSTTDGTTALMNGAKVGELPEASALTDADRWILHRLGEVRLSVDDALDGPVAASVNVVAK